MRRGAPPSHRTGPGADPGFVLIGVVMFVLALTILGLSLFGLSSYESQFLYRSYASDQALYDAQSGIEHVKFMLAKRDSMAFVSSGLFPANVFPSDVVYARAMRAGTTDSLHTISSFPPGTAITVRVMASVAGERRMVEANYVPALAPNLYKRLATVADTVYVKAHEYTNDDPPSDYPLVYVNLAGPMFVGSPPRGGQPASPEEFWYQWEHGAEITSPTAAPIPDVSSFIAAHQGEADALAPAADNFSMTAPPPPGKPVHYYYSDQQDDHHVYSLRQVDACAIDVSGIAVWLLPRGVRFENQVTINGGSNDCLVIVAGKSPNEAAPWTNAGIWFRASLTAKDLAVILVSDGRVQIEHFGGSNTLNSTRVDYASIFARNAWFGGPQDVPGGHTFTLQHISGDFRDGAGGLIDQLCDVGALPNSETGGVKFQPVAGTWKELDPDHPSSP